MSNKYDMFENLTFLLDSYEVKGVNNSIVDKIRGVLNEEEADALDEMLNAVRLPSDEKEVEKNLGDMSVEDVRDVFKDLVWENSDSWTEEMYNVPSNMLAYMSYVEINNFKQLIEKVKKTD